MVLGFLKMLGTASVALSGATTSLSSSPATTTMARHAAATMTTAAESSSALGVAAAPPANAGGREPMRVKSPLIYSFPISNLEDVSVCGGGVY